MRPVPFMPYLQVAPSAWVLPLKFDGGGYRAGGKAMFDGEGNLWVGNNFTIGWQASDALWQGNASKFDPNGKPLSPITTGFAGGGMQGGTFGAAIDLKGNVWLASYGSKSITVFDKNGKPLTPPEGINFGGKLGLMQGIITAPNGDVWALGVSKRQLLHFPKGDWNNGKIVCEGDSGEPCKSFTAPFHLAIDQQDRIWVSDSSVHVIRFPASDPTKAERFDVRSNNSGLNIDSQGNVWVTNRFGAGLLGLAHMVDMAVHLKTGGVLSASDYLTKTMSEQKGGSGSITVLRPDGTQLPGSPFRGDGLPGPWAVVFDGNDNALGLQLRDGGEPDRPAVRRAYRELPARVQDRRPDLAAGRLRRWRPAVADRHRRRPGRRRLGHEQLAGHRQLLPRRRRSTIYPLRRPGRGDLLRHGQAGARPADRACPSAVIYISLAAMWPGMFLSGSIR